MQPHDIQHWTIVAGRIAQQASLIAQSGFRKPMKVSHKADIDLVTEFDLRTEEFVRAQLARESPDFAVVAEEQGGCATGQCVWYVDPIDGTTNYAHGHPFWCVSVALAVDGDPVAGAVVAPSLGVQWTGSACGQALRNADVCVVSQQHRLADCFLATGFPYDMRTSSDDNLQVFASLHKQCLAVRRCGSAALDLCLVADGTYDGYWERKLKPWDIAAALLIVQRAGGTVTGFAGEKLSITGGEVVASNSQLHSQLLAALAQAPRYSRS